MAAPADAETLLRRGNGAEPSALDPHRTDGRVESNVLRDLFEGLTIYGPDGAIIGGAADRWEVSSDGTLYTFYLRDGAKWSNGDALTADDFVYSFRRALSPELGGLWSDFRIIQNASEVIAGTLPKDKLGVTADGPRTVKIQLNRPAPYFLAMLSSVNAGLPVHKASVEAGGANWAEPGKLVGNGAYVLSDWQPRKQLTVERNKNFYGKTAIDKVVYLPVDNANDELALFQSGQLDVTYEVPQEQVKWISNKYPNEFWNKPFLATYYYALNLTAEPFKGNLNLRKALSLAVDRDLIVEKVTRAGEMPAYGLVPPTVSNYSQPLPEFVAESKAKRLEQARRLFARAGYSPAQPLRLEILFNTSDNNRVIANSVISMWEQAFGKGIEVNTVSVDRVEYLKRRARRDFQVVRAAWIGDYPDPGVFLNLMISSAKPPRNDAGYRSNDYDGLLSQAAGTSDTAERADLLAKAEKTMIDDVPVIPIYHFATKSMVNPKLNGWVYNVRDVHPSRFLSFRD